MFTYLEGDSKVELFSLSTVLDMINRKRPIPNSARTNEVNSDLAVLHGEGDSVPDWRTQELADMDQK